MTNGYLNNLLAENEEVLLVTRQHWIVLLAEILPETILTIALVILISLIWLMWLPNPLVPIRLSPASAALVQFVARRSRLE